MNTSSWKFNEKENVMVITTKGIIESGYPILSVWHDADDGMWQFLEGNEVAEEDSMIVGLFEIVDIDHTIENVADLPLGWTAWRYSRESEWIMQPVDEGDDNGLETNNKL